MRITRRIACWRGLPVCCGCSIVLLLVLLSACGWGADGAPSAEASRTGTAPEAGISSARVPEEEKGRVASDSLFTDFATLVPPRSPNNWLVAPASFASATPDEVAPTMEAPAERLVEIWIEIIGEQPRARVLAVSEDRLQVEAEQASALFGFTDRISFRILPAPAGGRTLVAYSRAELGYWDLGVNRKRLKDWISKLQARAESDPA